MDGERPFRFISFNIPNLLVIEDAFEFTGSQPVALAERIRNRRRPRVGPADGRPGRADLRHQRPPPGLRHGPDRPRARPRRVQRGRLSQTLDEVLEVANRKGVRLIIPLVDNWKWMGGVPQYAAFRGKPARRILDRPAAHRRLQTNHRARPQSQEHDHRRPLQATTKRSSAGRRATKSTPRPSGLARSPPTSSSSTRTTWSSTAVRCTASPPGNSTSRTPTWSRPTTTRTAPTPTSSRRSNQPGPSPKARNRTSSANSASSRRTRSAA